MYERYLMHFGIKGMKWGVRRSPEELGHKPEGVHEDSWNARTKRASEMSDAELKKSITRIQQEQQYMSMTETSMDKAKKKVRSTLEESGGKVVSAIVGATAGLIAARYITKGGGMEMLIKDIKSIPGRVRKIPGYMRG